MRRRSVLGRRGRWKPTEGTCLVIGQLRAEAMAMDTAALDALWDGLDRVGTHFWKAEASAVTWNPGREPSRQDPSTPSGSSGGRVVVHHTHGGLRLSRFGHI